MVVVGCCVIVEQVQGAGSRCRMAECQVGMQATEDRRSPACTVSDNKHVLECMWD